MATYIDRHPLSQHFEFYSASDSVSRSCPYCGHQLFQVTSSIFKCLHDGFTLRAEGTLQEQHHYDFNTSSSKSKGLKKTAYPQTELLPEEYEYNLLVWAGWEPEDALKHVVEDMRLKDSRLYYFEKRVEEKKEEKSPGVISEPSMMK